MSSPRPLKRRKYNEKQEISPPPLRRNRNTTQTPLSEEVCPNSQKGEESSVAKEKGNSLKKPRGFEIISWNVNGISHLLPLTQKSIKSFFAPPSPQGETCDPETSPSISPLRRFLKRHHWPQFLCLQEVKIFPRDSATKLVVERAANGNQDEGPGYKAYFSLPSDKFNAKGWGGKVYGVCTLLREDIAGLKGQQTREVDWDLEGRVLVTELPSLADLQKIVVINGYWVNGTLNPYRNSQTGEVEGTRHDRKREFHRLMLEEVKRYEEKGWDVVLVSDMNVARDERDGYPGIRLGLDHVRNRKDFNAKFFDDEKGMKGVDSWKWVHGEKRGYSYHGEPAEEWGRSCDRVDMGVVSRALVERGMLIGAEIWESVEERGGSDHVPISVVLDIGDFFS